MPSTTPRAGGLGPLETIVNVQWLSGYFIYVETLAVYEHGDPETRVTTITLTKAGEDAGGAILGQKTEHIPATFPFPPVTAHKALLKFARQPNRYGTPLWKIKLEGSIQIPSSDPPPLVPPFCGVDTFTATVSRIYQTEVPGEPRLKNHWRDVEWVRTTPAGTGTLNWTVGPLDMFQRNIDWSGYTMTGSGTSIWYQDAFGNWVDTGLPCSDLVDNPPPPSSRTEGWEYVRVEVMPKRGYRAKAVQDWADGPSNVTQVTEATPTSTSSSRYGGPAWIALLGPRNQGLNGDFKPVYDDIPNSTIEFTNQIMQFEHMPEPQPKTVFKVYAAYPLTPLAQTYSLRVAAPSAYRVYEPPKEAIPGEFPAVLRDKIFQAGTTPPVDQIFNLL